jgi:Spy/CpxP family protein refolding chaperone
MGVAGLLTALDRGLAQEGVPPPPPAHGPRLGRGWDLDLDEMVDRMSRKLDLRADQQEKMKDLVERFRASHGDAMARARELRDALRAAHENGTRPSREDMEALARQYGNPGRELWPALEQLRDDARSVLDPEQRRKLDDLRSRWRHDCPGRHRPDRGVAPDRSPSRPPPPVPPS